MTLCTPKGLQEWLQGWLVRRCLHLMYCRSRLLRWHLLRLLGTLRTGTLHCRHPPLHGVLCLACSLRWLHRHFTYLLSRDLPLASGPLLSWD